MNGPAHNLRWLLDDARAPAVAIGGLTSDSRRVLPGDAFIAYRGAAFDGHDFAAEAVAAGAVAVISERPVEVGVANAVVAGVGSRLGDLARRFHGHPSGELAVVGVTGTNGKTTVAYLIASAFGRAAYIGTLGWGRPPELCPSLLTTADPLSLQAQLRSLKDRGADVVALEASSHALDQGRVDAVDFAVGIFTNLSRDHLDYHGTMQRYAAAKRRLFERALRIGVVNVDDVVGRAIADQLPAAMDCVEIGRKAALRWAEVAYHATGVEGIWITPWGRERFSLPGLFGEFSIYNAACALGASCALGMPLADVVAAMAQLTGVPGRMQLVARTPTVAVDYAHTPDGLRAVLAAARAHLTAGGKVIVVFGCGGERDRGKRAQMARAAEAGAELVIATSDNPRREDPERILDDVAAGFRKPAAAVRISDRHQAIATALERAAAADIVVLAGKGHEQFQAIGGCKVPFSDAAVVREVLGGA